MTFKTLRHFALPVAACAVSLALACSAWWAHDEAAGRYEHALVEQNALAGELAGLQRDRHILQEFLGDYRQLNAQGAFTGEDRLDWIAAVERAVKELNLLHVRYTVYPQQPYADAALPRGASRAVKKSPMRLELGLTHEGELLDFLQTVQTGVRGTLHVAGCVLERLVPGERFEATTANVSAICEIDWLTLADAREVSDG